MLFIHGSFESRPEECFQRRLCNLGHEQLRSRWDILLVPIKPLLVKEVGVGAQGLHQPLSSTITEKLGDGPLLGNLLPEIEKSVLILLGVIEVGVVNQGREIILLSPEPETLEIDDPCLSLVNDQVLGLKVAVYQIPMGGSQIVTESCELIALTEIFPIEPQVLLDQIIDKVVLFPSVGFRPKWRRELEGFRHAGVEKAIELFQSTTVVGFPCFPWFIAEGQQILVSKILNKSYMASLIVVEDLRDIQAALLEKVSYILLVLNRFFLGC